MIKGLYETHLFVEQLERSIEFYGKTLELKQCRYEAERKAAFFWIGKDKQAMLGLWEKPKEEIDIRHFAFECEPEWVLNESIAYLKSRHLHCRNFLNDGTERPMVFAWMPAISIYFDDPDGHTLEFIGILDGKGNPREGIISYGRWLALRQNENQ
ncbi:MAG: VOC family protein [Bacteroidota bacterium]